MVSLMYAKSMKRGGRVLAIVETITELTTAFKFIQLYWPGVTWLEP